MKFPEIACDSELFERLSLASPEEVDVLVDIVTDFSRGRVGLDSDIKKQLVLAKHSSRPIGYTPEQLRLLGRELQHFGGNSAMNLARRLLNRSALAYAEIVSDVYQKLNGVGEASVAEKERRIALALFGDAWRDLAVGERIERATSASVLAGLFNIEDALMKSVGKSLGKPLSVAIAAAATAGMRFNPLGAALTAGVGLQSSVAEAYRVTIPFVAQMGWIRLRHENSALAGLSLANPKLEDEEPSLGGELVVQDQQGSTMFKLSVVNRSPAVAHHSLPLDGISVLSPLMASVPGLAALGELSRGNYVVCSLPFETLTRSTSGDGSARAFVRAGGRISEQATLSLPEDLQNVLLGGAIWNAVSAAVGQKHLHDISEKLTAIKRQLDDVLRELDESRWEALVGMVEYTQSVLEHYSEDGVDNVARQALEIQQSRVAELAQYFDRKMKEEIGKALELKVDKLFGVDGARGEIKASMARMAGWANGRVQAAQLQVVSCALRYLAEPLQRYRSEAVKALESLEHLDGISMQCVRVYGSQMELTNSRLFNMDASERQRFAAQLEELTVALNQGPSDTRSLHQSLFNLGEKQVLLRCEGGEIVEAQLLGRAI